MKVWLINSSEGTPIDAGDVRLRRTSLLAQTLVNRGHEVLWWNVDFFHATKKYRFGENRTVELKPRYTIRFMHGPGYRKNISFARLRDHKIVADQFRSESRTTPKPDVILCSLPTLDLSLAAVRYGKEHDVPVVLDIRDLWPDVWIESAPSSLRLLAKLSLLPFVNVSRKVCRDATALIGNSPRFVEWGLQRAGRAAGPWERDFPFGYEEPELTESDVLAADTFWRTWGLDWKNRPRIVVFFGTLGHQFRFDEALQACEKVLSQEKNVFFVFCGNGERFAEFRRIYADEPRMVFPGWVNAKQIWQLMRYSFAALAPYNINDNFRHNLTNKLIEYMAGRLPILFSIDDGFVADLIREHEIGLTYGGSADRLAGAILRLLEDEPYCKKLAENAKNLYLEKYRSEAVYSDMAEHLERIASSNR